MIELKLSDLDTFIENYKQLLKIDNVNFDVQEQIYMYKTFLAASDYIIVKIMEAMIYEESVEKIKEKYKDILLSRKVARIKINELLSGEVE